MTGDGDVMPAGDGAGLRIGIDVGGTFTDLVAIDDAGATHVFKTSSTPSDPAEGVLAAIDQAAAALAGSRGALLRRCHSLIHGTTVATNILLERKGARVGLLATAGFRDSLAIRRGLRANPWDHRSPNPEVLVPRFLRLGVGGRIDAAGRQVEALDEEAVIAAAQAFARHDVQAVAVCLFNSFLAPQHEERAAELLAKHWGGSWLSLSHQVAPLIGEYERSSTTVINAYVGPHTVRYLERLDRVLNRDGLARPMLLMQSNGGAVSVRQVAQAPYKLLLSGPAAAVGALRHLSRSMDSPNLISMEIGGTSCDVLLMSDGQVALTDQVEISDYHLTMPSVDIHTIGAGGGTIAGIDRAGMLFVGPQGAGAVPGPAAYGRGGTEPTVTDAHLVLGRLKSGAYGGGAVTLDPSLAGAAFAERLTGPLGLELDAAATGVIRILDQNLLHAVQRISIERGEDPSRFVLVAAGGAGPMHGARIGRLLGCRSVLVPRLSGAFCAFGMLHSDVRHDFVRTYLAQLGQLDIGVLADAFGTLEEQGRSLLAGEGFAGAAVRIRRELSLRYIGQQWDIAVDVTAFDPAGEPDRTRADFEARHLRLFGHIQPDGPVEVTSLRVVATGILPDAVQRQPAPSGGPPVPAEHRDCYLGEGGWQQVRVYAGAALEPGHRLDGPLIVEEQTTTIVVGPADILEVDRFGNYLIHLPDGRTDHA
ncbi:MAG: hydantoinase/oxoprolinase family protein [Sneathiellaceae bacterium]